MGNRPDAWVRQLPGLTDDTLVNELTRPILVTSRLGEHARPLVPSPEDGTKLLRKLKGNNLAEFKRAILKALEAVHEIKAGAANKGKNGTLTLDEEHGVVIGDGGIDREEGNEICVFLGIGMLGHGSNNAHWYLRNYTPNNRARVISSGWQSVSRFSRYNGGGASIFDL